MARKSVLVVVVLACILGACSPTAAFPPEPNSGTRLGVPAVNSITLAGNDKLPSAQAGQTVTSGVTTATSAEGTTTPVPTGTLSGNLAPGVVFGAQIDAREIMDPQVCSTAKELGVTAANLWFKWQQWEPRPGTFNSRQVDQIVQGFVDCGISDLGIHFQSQSRWGTATTPARSQGQPQGSGPPTNPDDFYNAVFQLAAHLKGKVQRYSFENEASGPEWAGSVESYFQTLTTFYRAVHDADPNAVVEDSGTAGRAFGIIIANQKLQSGQGQGAVDFLNEYYAHFSIGGEPVHLSSVTDLTSFLEAGNASGRGIDVPSEVQKTDQFMPMLYSDSAMYDVNQIHYYGPWDLLTTILNYAHDRMQQAGRVRPIEIWELGYGWQQAATYDPTAHAQDTVKLLAVSAGEGVRRIIYWPLYDKSEKGTPGLMKANQTTPAGLAYKVTAQFLAGSTDSEKVDLGNPAVWAYKFSKNGQDTYVVWSTAPVVVSLPDVSGSVAITDIMGKSSSGNSSSIAVDVSPIFVQASP